MSSVPVFDGHNDVLSHLARPSTKAEAVARFRTDPSMHVTAHSAAAGNMRGGFFAIWVPSAGTTGPPPDVEMSTPPYDLPLADEVKQGLALAMANRQLSIALALEAAGEIRICRDSQTLEATVAGQGPLAAVIHMEGAEPIDEDLEALDVFHAAGLRSLGPVWSRHNRFGHGVPFRFPSPPDTGPGLTEAGVRLVKRCDALRIAIDLSHITEAGFWDVARHSTGPLIATHSNVHKLSPHARNLTDRQLDAIAERDGMVGLNFATAFLRKDGAMRPHVPMEQILLHVDRLLERLGENRVGLGSDFDGAMIPDAIGSAAGLPVLISAMLDHGFGESLVAKIAHGNWLRVLRQTWGG